jgi:hypothetical protein
MSNWIDDYLRVAGNNYTNSSPMSNTNSPVANTTQSTVLANPYSRRNK